MKKRTFILLWALVSFVLLDTGFFILYSTRFNHESTSLEKKINEFRKSESLSPFVSTKRTCDFAQTRVKEIAENFSHDGFLSRESSQKLPYLSHLLTENLARQPKEDDQQILEAWIASPTHLKNLLADTTEVCIMQMEGRDGRIYYAMEGVKKYETFTEMDR